MNLGGMNSDLEIGLPEALLLVKRWDLNA